MPDNTMNYWTLNNAQMTPIVEIVPGSSNDSENGTVSDGSTQVSTNITPGAPSFSVPSNPLLPPGYQETLDYNSLQYANGFYRTQIGKYVRVDQLLGSNNMTTQEGFLIGVGYNYIILQEGFTENILVVDIYSIKNMYVYYNDRVPAYFGAVSNNQESDI